MVSPSDYLRGFTIAFSMLVHAGLMAAFFVRSGPETMFDGKGHDELTVAATVTVEDGSVFGPDPQNQQAREATAPSLAAEDAKPETVREPETLDAVDRSLEPEPLAAPQAETHEANKPPEREPPAKPVVEPAPRKPDSAAAAAQEDKEASARAFEGRMAGLRSAYYGRVSLAVNQPKVRPRSLAGIRASGRVTMLITIAPSGRLLSQEVVKSSGNAVLDRAAAESVGRTSFPAMPAGLPDAPMTFTVPFEYSTR